MNTHCYRPKTIVEYNRKACIAKENKIRVTLDNHIVSTESCFDLFSEGLNMNPVLDAYDDDFYDTFSRDCITMIDVIHGNKKLSLGRMASAGHGTYRKDVSPWVIGYI